MPSQKTQPPPLSPQTLNALTHHLTTTTTTSLHSQLLLSTLLPSSPHHPPLLSSTFSHLNFGLRFFLKTISPFRPPTTSWRSKCPYQQPPPAVLAKGVEEAKWDDEDRKVYVRKRMRRKRLVSDVHPLVPFLVPNLVLFSMLLWDPFPVGDK